MGDIIQQETLCLSLKFFFSFLTKFCTVGSKAFSYRKPLCNLILLVLTAIHLTLWKKCEHRNVSICEIISAIPLNHIEFLTLFMQPFLLIQGSFPGCYFKVSLLSYSWFNHLNNLTYSLIKPGYSHFYYDIVSIMKVCLYLYPK